MSNAFGGQSIYPLEAECHFDCQYSEVTTTVVHGYLPECLPDEATAVTGRFDLRSLLECGPKTNSSLSQSILTNVVCCTVKTCYLSLSVSHCVVVVVVVCK